VHNPRFAVSVAVAAVLEGFAAAYRYCHAAN